MISFIHLIVLLVLTIPGLSQAEFYEKDQLHIYKIRNYVEVLSDEEIIEFTAKMSHVAFTSVLESMVEKKVFPQEVVSIEDVEKLRKANKDVATLVMYLNQLVEEQREGNSRFSLPDALPDAIMVHGGKKLSLNIGGGLGGSVSLGLVLMPVYVEKYSQRTGELVDEYFTVRFAVVGWTNADAGVGLGGGSSFRLGVAAIWDLNDAFNQPEQFWGAGIGASWAPVVLGAGLNAKVGVVSNWDMPGWVDFAYASASVELGMKAEVSSPRVNFTSFFSGGRIMALLESSQRKAFEAALKDLSKKMDRVFIELNKDKEPEVHTQDDEENEEIKSLSNP